MVMMAIAREEIGISEYGAARISKMLFQRRGNLDRATTAQILGISPDLLAELEMCRKVCIEVNEAKKIAAFLGYEYEQFVAIADCNRYGYSDRGLQELGKIVDNALIEKAIGIRLAAEKYGFKNHTEVYSIQKGRKPALSPDNFDALERLCNIPREDLKAIAQGEKRANSVEKVGAKQFNELLEIMEVEELLALANRINELVLKKVADRK